MTTNQELFHQWMDKKHNVSTLQIITKLVQLGEIEEAKIHLNELKDQKEIIFNGTYNRYDLAIKHLSKPILKKLLN